MKNKRLLFRLSLFSLLLATVCVLANSSIIATQKQKPKTYTKVEDLKSDADFQLQGEYVDETSGVQVVAQGNGNFLVVTYKGGLPGEGYDGKTKTSLEDTTEGVKIAIDAMKKVDRKSKTLGQKAPKGAVVLFDGSENSLKKHWQKGARIEDGMLREGASTVDTFQDYSLHVEFKLSYSPLARGQGRANSGIYHQGRYETQVLDSFGLEGKNNELGGIYEISNPSLNMCYPPLKWQTYDIDFTAARFDEAGKKIKNAKLTVRLNGVIVQNDVEVPRTTRASPTRTESSEPGPIHIQNHGNPIFYRNIWIVPKDPARNDNKPKISSLERFYSAPGSDQLTAGTVLLEELNCQACHKAAGINPAVSLNPKIAPHLTNVGERVNQDYLENYLMDVHAKKAGTTMPNLFAGLTPEQKKLKSKSLAAFLGTTGNIVHAPVNRLAVNRGQKLFETVGCAVCHGKISDSSSLGAKTSIPLGPLHEKYSVNSLKNFLKNPHVVRPSGRMPSLLLTDKELIDVASYLLQNIDPKYIKPNIMYQVYHGDWDNLPDFSTLKPVEEGETNSFDIGIAKRKDKFGIVYTSELVLKNKKNIKFHLSSDDGSRLLINDKELIKMDGIHPRSSSSRNITLDKGKHKIVIEYFEGGGEEILTVEVEEKSMGRVDLATVVTLPGAKPLEPATEQTTEDVAMLEKLIEMGRKDFVSVGCANCHQLKLKNTALKPELKAPSLVELATKLKTEIKGCLSESPQENLPWYSLSDQQIEAIKYALAKYTQADVKAPDAAWNMHKTLVSNNCYACHVRGGVGGPEQNRNSYFVTTIPEMGDEGRLPPILDGVGDKLQESYLNDVWKNGANHRQYMLTRMPKFGDQHVGHLTSTFVSLDLKTEAPVAEFKEPLYRTKGSGRFLAGDKGLACVKCHTFDKYPATGIQAVPLDKMTKRLREDWFRRYLLDPAKFRPGTRMPTGFPMGVAAVKDVYHGDSTLQIASIWEYLKDGNKAAVPQGLIPNPIELIPVDKPIIYRNFIQNLSSRGIAVGYPEKMNIAFDAEDNCLKLIWHGAFLDAGMHWRGRGQGRLNPLGDHIVRLEEKTPVVVVGDEDAKFKFKGYSLNAKGQPTFKYAYENLIVNDEFLPVKTAKDPHLNRKFMLENIPSNLNLQFVAASGKVLEKVSDGEYLIDNYLKIKTSGNLKTPEIVDAGNGNKKLVFTIVPADGKASFEQLIQW